MESHAVPGAVLGIYDGGIGHTEGFGVTSIENPLPVGPYTILRTAGSPDLCVTSRASVGLRTADRPPSSPPIHRRRRCSHETGAPSIHNSAHSLNRHQASGNLKTCCL